MWGKLTSVHGGKLRPLFFCLHIGFVSVLLALFSESRKLSILSLIFAYFLCSFIVGFSSILYLVAAYRNPGYVNSEIIIKKTYSQSPNPSTPYTIDIEDRNEALPSSNSEISEEKMQFSLDASEAKASLRRSEQPRTRIRNFSPFLTEMSEQKPINSLFVTISPMKSSVWSEGEKKVASVTGANDGEAGFMPRYCTICNMEQPVRAKHCTICKKCVHRYDHHCTWLGNCIGERNHLFYYAYLLFQSLELTLALYYLSSTVEDCPYQAVPILILLVPNELFSCFLFGLHSYLAVQGLTTWELISWKRISYLGEREKSPFASDYFRNLSQFISSIEVKDWNQLIIK